MNMKNIFGWRFVVLVSIVFLFLNALPAAAADNEDFFDELNLDYPGLEKVKSAVNKKDYAAARAEFANYMKNRAATKYFFDYNDKSEIVDIINAKFPKRKKTYIDAADIYLEHKFTLAGLEKNLGSNINWRICGAAAECSAVLNKLGWLKTLGRAYWFSGDEKYSAEFVALLNDWMNDNPVPLSQTRANGNPWRTLDSSARAINLVDSYNYFMASPKLKNDFHIKLLSSIYDHGNYLYAGVKSGNYNGVGNNWAVFEAQGLATLALMFPEFKDARQWRDISFDVLKKHAREEFNNDGAYIEIAAGYHNGMVLAYFSVYRLAEINGVSFSISEDTFKEMFYWLAKMQNPAGRVPALADSGYAADQNYRSVLGLGALNFNDSYLKYLAVSDADENMLWYFGKNVFTDYKNISKKEPDFKSIKMDDTQLIVMRSGWAKTDKYLLFDCAPFGTSGHSHSDALNVAAYSGSTAIATDSGVCSYDDPAAKYYQSFRAHNVAIINGNDNYGAAVFHQPVHSKPEINSFITADDYDFASCSMNRQTRRVLFVKPDYWVIYDTVDSSSNSIDLLFHNPNDDFSKITSLDDISARSITQSVPGTAYSPLLNGKYLAYSKKNSAATGLATMLHPDLAASAIGKSVLPVLKNGKAVSSAEASGYKISYRDKNQKNIIDYILFSANASEKEFGDLSFDGTVGFARDSADGYRFLMIGGTKFDYDDLKINISQKKLTVISAKSVTGTICGLAIDSAAANGKAISARKEGDCYLFAAAVGDCDNVCAKDAKRCDGNGVQTCALSGGCLKWGAAVACENGKTCGDGVCQTTCAPKTCATLGNYECGSWSDGCGKTISCGTCASGKTCSSGICSMSACPPKTCSSLGYECGRVSDGCGITLNCGSCGSGSVCFNRVCVSQSSGGSGGGGGGGGGATNPPITTKPVTRMTRAEIIAKINEIVALIAKLQEQLKAMTGEKYSCVQITKVLRYGMQNDLQVKCLQEVLEAQGYAVVVSGNYDLATKSAVKMFQGKNAKEILAPYGLRAGSGNAGNATLGKINMLIAGG
jgi:hypothetical protein